ncbi:hypothetical protein JZ751_011335 [Albula glossodonta]|uniref:Uncharacterized protein n=1 Tax=Albula glossodonta TaxID=121402 RepID=A0A8T2ML36_9TELE|nr:hypothetical protein JZ751_011335 [Albula glossodonta]
MIKKTGGRRFHQPAPLTCPVRFTDIAEEFSPMVVPEAPKIGNLEGAQPLVERFDDSHRLGSGALSQLLAHLNVYCPAEGSGLLPVVGRDQLFPE